MNKKLALTLTFAGWRFVVRARRVLEENLAPLPAEACNRIVDTLLGLLDKGIFEIVEIGGAPANATGDRCVRLGLSGFADFLAAAVTAFEREGVHIHFPVDGPSESESENVDPLTRFLNGDLLPRPVSEPTSALVNSAAEIAEKTAPSSASLPAENPVRFASSRVGSHRAAVAVDAAGTPAGAPVLTEACLSTSRPSGGAAPAPSPELCSEPESSVSSLASPVVSDD